MQNVFLLKAVSCHDCGYVTGLQMLDHEPTEAEQQNVKIAMGGMLCISISVRALVLSDNVNKLIIPAMGNGQIELIINGEPVLILNSFDDNSYWHKLHLTKSAGPSE